MVEGIGFSFVSYLLLSFVPIILQSFVVYYLSRVSKFIGRKSTYILLGMSSLGFIYDFIVTSAILFNQVNKTNVVTFVGLFLGFVYPIAHSGLMLWIIKLMERGTRF